MGAAAERRGDRLIARQADADCAAARQRASLPSILEILYARRSAERRAELDAPGYGASDYATVRAATLALMRGAILHIRCSWPDPDPLRIPDWKVGVGLTVGRGLLVDWRGVPGEQIGGEGQPDALLAIEACRLVGPEAVAAAVRRAEV